MVFIALPWLALEITGSAASAGALVALTSIPGIFFGPILGTLLIELEGASAALFLRFYQL